MEFDHQYWDAIRELEIDLKKDGKATQILDKILKKEDIKHLRNALHSKTVVVYGCGPSLENDVNKIWDAGLHKHLTHVAVDGAVKALLQYRILPKVNVTDLGGDLRWILKANEYGCNTIVHARDKNIDSMVKLLPHFKGRVYGSTHTKPTSKVHNFGGFTDGDRALSIVWHFKPRFTILCGMDFGHVIGVYSGKYDPVTKPRHMRVGKKLIEDIAKKQKGRVFNFTSGGEILKNMRKIDVDKLSALI
jgi:hypothetical protein